MNIIIWSNAALLLPDVPLPYVIAACIALSFPTNYLKDFSLLSFLSVFGLVCIVLIVAVVCFDLLAPSSLPPPPPRTLADVTGVPMSASIMLAGLTGHVALPPMYAEMKTPSSFKPVLYGSFSIMLGIYALVGAGGYLLYGGGADILITQDMADSASSGYDHFIVSLVLGGIAFKLFCSVPMCVVVLVDILENLYEEHQGAPLGTPIVDRARIALWVCSTLCSIAVYDSLQYVTALIGINSMLISVLLPTVFYLMLHRRKMGAARAAAYGALVAASVAVTVVIAYVDIGEFLQSLAGLGS